MFVNPNDYPLIQTIFCLESGFPFITRAVLNLVITTFQINFGEYFGFRHHIQHIIQQRNEKMVLYYYLVNCATITHIRHVPSFFAVSRAGTAQGLILSFYKAPLQQFVNLSLQLRMLSRIHPIMQ